MTAKLVKIVLFIRVLLLVLTDLVLHLTQAENSKIPQIGNVLIEDNVEIGSNVLIDRATMGSTFIRKGVKIDNLCQIAHNVDVDENSAMAAQVGIAGSSKIGKNVLIGGQAE